MKHNVREPNERPIMAGVRILIVSSKHGISIVLKLFSIEYQKGMHFWQLCN